jgi:methionyl-tRNA synthetase
MFLDLPKLEPELKSWIAKSSEEGKWTANSIAITDGWIQSGLRPRCITRDLKWGTPVPHERFKDKVFYVWFDAPIGYISITANYTSEWKQWWQNPEQVKLVQFMGKDNIPFHTVIFPSSLIGTRKPWTLLHHVSTTEYLNYESGKFSKSRGVGVFGDSAMDTGIPSEVWRYYLLACRPESSDSVFTWSDFAEKNNGELLKCLGNLVQRAMAFAYETFDAKSPIIKGALTDRDNEFVAEVNTLLREYITLLEAVKIKAGLKVMMDIAASANRYMQDSAPWTVKKVDLDRCSTILAIVASTVRLISAIAEPFMPGFTDKVVHMLNVPHSNIPDVFDVNFMPGGHPFNKPTPLFAEITAALVEEYRTRFGGAQATTTDEPAAAKAVKEKPKAVAKKGGVTLPDAARIDLRVGKIIRAWPHPESEKLWCEEVRERFQ